MYCMCVSVTRILQVGVGECFLEWRSIQMNAVYPFLLNHSKQGKIYHLIPDCLRSTVVMAKGLHSPNGKKEVAVVAPGVINKCNLS